MKLLASEIPEVLLVSLEILQDEFGSILKAFDDNEFQSEVQKLGHVIPKSFVYEFSSITQAGAAREIDYHNAPNAQARLVETVRNSALHVVVDMRSNVPTFGHAFAIVINEADRQLLWIPEGFAHGYIALEGGTHVRTRCSIAKQEEDRKIISWYSPAIEAVWRKAAQGKSVPDILPSVGDVEISPDRAVKLNSGVRHVDFRIIGDHRGSLVAIEGGGNIPFDIKRVYYIFNTKSDVGRGYHAHKHLQQIAICLKGQCRMIVDDGSTRESILLDHPSKGLLISNLIWREMHDFSDDCVLMVLASARYDEADYIRNYESFLLEAQNAKK